MEDKMQKIISLCKRRGFVFPGSEIYGGLANTWDYGSLGVELSNNIKQLWWKRFVKDREDVVGISSAILMNPKVWEASGHLKGFSDPLVECKKCHSRLRADHLRENYDNKCPNCKGEEFTDEKQFNLMFKTFLGPVDDEKSVVYLRPETAQGMFVNFKNVQQTSRKKLPFGIAQIGKAFRNEITPGNFIFRILEFEQMEIEYFIEEDSWQSVFEMWQAEMQKWLVEALGIKKENFVIREHEKSELSHYSKRTVDFEYNYPFGQKELYGLAYRTNFDLTAHKLDLDGYIPHVIEPTFGVDRTILAVLCDAYREEGERVVLKLKPTLAPYKVAVFPLLANKPELVKKAREVFNLLKNDFMTAWDDRGNIGKRYFSQDEIGTPYCLTIDFDTLQDNTITLRDRDTAKQERISISVVVDFVKQKL
ncbi:glycine--tRNA ligase [bacterium (Candidatus Gribaldobacteria) CG23_combo_of_CG06-09_8_20_14_all_37_87_8]|uniref:Glycine--tRNA ligase n=2 Tax=Candidatus Gribaldobacteria TaxID=2798536 RepID=A0A2G9ZEW2_9BACT|nr:MAG: glycine--tRNA ligase [Parcubacteria group bacterium CG1_02_37_13]PIP31704.1 MAG: glycine--tRNA ligase [bacterium (Candidatus Gribaldobacteria) CG23_combo_of_CG06-09_8_20_14_all_37_87_8]PIR90007.1 MAG: glycine--tRNA ligase [bacterium (Candidatus Gribaldobacteria) CG10_big_fil_rev_8_21_14_0_10_37_21]